MLEWILGVLGLLLGLGLMSRFLPVPKIVGKVLGAFAALVLVVMFWGFLSLPTVEVLQDLTSNVWVLGLSLGYLVGNTIGDLLFWQGQ